MHPCTKHIFLSVLRNSSSQDCLKMSSRKTGLDHPSFACNDVLYCVRYQGPCLCIILWEILLLQPYCEWDKGVMKASAKRGLVILDTQKERKTTCMLHNKCLVLIVTVFVSHIGLLRNSCGTLGHCLSPDQFHKAVNIKSPDRNKDFENWKKKIGLEIYFFTFN